MDALVETSGEGQGLVLLAGTLTGWNSWARILPALRARRQVTRVQPIRSQLALTGPTVPVDYGPLTERRALDHALSGMDGLDLVGWAAGGREALTWAVWHPERVRSLTLVEPTCFGLLDEASLDGDAGAAVGGLRALTRRLSGGPVEEEDVAEYAERSALAEPGEGARSHFRWPDWLVNRQALALEEVLMSDGPTVAELGMLAVPTVLVVGDRTAAHHRAVVDLLAELVPSAAKMEMPGGHACHLEGLDRFVSIISA